MRIDEITINIPIKIQLDGGEPKVNVAGQDAEDEDWEEEVDLTQLQDPNVMVSPLQQEIEIKKAQAGKKSPVVDNILGRRKRGS